MKKKKEKKKTLGPSLSLLQRLRLKHIVEMWHELKIINKVTCCQSLNEKVL